MPTLARIGKSRTLPGVAPDRTICSVPVKGQPIRILYSKPPCRRSFGSRRSLICGSLALLTAVLYGCSSASSHASTDSSSSPSAAGSVLACPTATVVSAAVAQTFTGPTTSYGVGGSKICRYTGQSDLYEVQVVITDPATRAEFNGQQSAAASGATVVTVPGLGQAAYAVQGAGTVEVLDHNLTVWVSSFNITIPQAEDLARAALTARGTASPDQQGLGLGTAVASPIEGLPVPSSARLAFTRTSSNEQLAQYSIEGASVARVDSWYETALPPGKPWPGWEACTRSAGVTSFPGEGARRIWSSQGGASVQILTSSGDGNAAVITITKEATPMSPDPCG
jgi:hypothetical protein